VRRCADAWQRFFYTAEPSAALDRFRVYLAVWTGAWALTHLPHAQELYCRPILREASPTCGWHGRRRRWRWW